jgi:hypothetical protein
VIFEVIPTVLLAQSGSTNRIRVSRAVFSGRSFAPLCT